LHDKAELLKVVKDILRLPEHKELKVMPYSESFKIRIEDDLFYNYVVLKIKAPGAVVSSVCQAVEKITG
jgi:hypothetical protein